MQHVQSGEDAMTETTPKRTKHPVWGIIVFGAGLLLLILISYDPDHFQPPFELFVGLVSIFAGIALIGATIFLPPEFSRRLTEALTSKTFVVCNLAALLFNVNIRALNGAQLIEAYSALMHDRCFRDIVCRWFHMSEVELWISSMQASMIHDLFIEILTSTFALGLLGVVIAVVIATIFYGYVSWLLRGKNKAGTVQ